VTPARGQPGSENRVEFSGRRHRRRDQGQGGWWPPPRIPGNSSS